MQHRLMFGREAMPSPPTKTPPQMPPKQQLNSHDFPCNNSPEELKEIVAAEFKFRSARIISKCKILKKAK